VSDAFVLVLVCTANRFRSPLAAAIVRDAVRGLPVDVRSYAAAGPSGPAALREALERAGRFGVCLGDHVATRLGAGELAGVDLVLGFERAHVAAAVVDGGAPRGRAFTLPEFVPLAEATGVAQSDPVTRARAVVAAAADARAVAAPIRLAELADPAGGPAAGFDVAAREVHALSRRLVAALFGIRTQAMS
jgi:protein-tyrosine-phosphatase